MAFSSYRTKFQGKLANIETAELKELDYNIGTLKGRKDFLDEKYNKVMPFYNTYIFTKEGESDITNLTDEDYKEYYKVNVNTNDELSGDINIFRYLEADGSYLLNSPDVPKGKRQQEYAFLSEEEFRKLLHKERMNVSLDTPEVMTMVKPKDRNHYIGGEIEIKRADLLDEECGEILSQYETMRLHLKEEMSKIKNKEASSYDLGFVKRNLGGLKGDMVDCKRMLKGIRCPAKRLGDESGMFYNELIDYTNEAHVKGILRTVRITGEIEPDSDLSHIAFDMETAIKALHKSKKLDDLDLEIIECLNSGYTERAIAKELEKGSTTIQQRIAKIVKRIAKYFNEDK